MNGDNVINFSYLAISVLILFVVYAILKGMKNSFHKNKNNMSRNTILVETGKDIMRMQPDIFEVHLNRLKNSLTSLNNTFSDYDCDEIKQYLDSSHNDLQKFIKLNKNDMSDSDFCTLDSDDIIIDRYISNERELIQRKLMNKGELLQDSRQNEDDDSKQLYFKLQLLDIIVDIEIITFLIRNSVCKNGKIDIVNLHKLIEKMYENNCVKNQNAQQQKESNEYFSEPDLILDYDTTCEGELLAGYGMPGKCSKNVGSNSRKSQSSHNSEGSGFKTQYNTNNFGCAKYKKYNPYGADYAFYSDNQNSCNEQDNILYSVFSRDDIFQQNNTRPECISAQIFGSSDVVIEKNPGVKPKHRPFYDINHIKKERSRIHTLKNETNCKRSLMSDYDFLDA